MEFDWSLYDPRGEPTRKQIEECFEDPFNLRLMPDANRFAENNRFFCLGKDNSDHAWVVVYTTNGRLFRVVGARKMFDAERIYYERKLREAL